MTLKHPETCRYCGASIRFFAADAEAAGRRGWQVLNAGTFTPHQCERQAAKIYTPEEREEFARRRAAGEI